MNSFGAGGGAGGGAGAGAGGGVDGFVWIGFWSSSFRACLNFNFLFGFKTWHNNLALFLKSEIDVIEFMRSSCN